SLLPCHFLKRRGHTGEQRRRLNGRDLAMRGRNLGAWCLAGGVLLACAGAASGQTLRASFDNGLKAETAAGRAEPWVAKNVELVPGKFGKAALVKPGGQLIYAGELNVQAGRGTLAFWCKVPERPGELDVQRLVFVQAKERGYWT